MGLVDRLHLGRPDQNSPTGAESTQSRKKRHPVRNILAATAAVGVLVPSVVNLPTSWLAAQSMLGVNVSCVGDTPPAHSGYEADAIVVPGTGSRPNRKVRTEAAAIEYVHGKAPYVIFVNGKKDDTREEKRLFRRDVWGLDGSLPQGALITNSASDVTPNNAANLKKIADEYASRGIPLREFNFVSTQNTGELTVQACGIGLKARDVPAVPIVLKQDPDAHFRLYSSPLQEIFSRLKKEAEKADSIVNPSGSWISNLNTIFMSPSAKQKKVLNGITFVYH